MISVNAIPEARLWYFELSFSSILLNVPAVELNCLWLSDPWVSNLNSPYKM